MRLHLHTATEDANLRDILDRILDKGIVMDPSIRLLVGGVDLLQSGARIVVAPERRRRPFVVPGKASKTTH